MQTENVYLGNKKLSEKEIKYIDDTYFWNFIENINILKNLEKELKNNLKL